MLKRTHLAISLAVGMEFLPYVSNKLFFLAVLFVATILPDIDSGVSNIGNRPWARPFQWLSGHRGVFHSYTFCFLLTGLLVIYYPSTSLAFFTGYAFHLFADSFTVMGIRPFWPFKQVSNGIVVTGGKTDSIIFWTFVLIDIALLMIIFL